MKTTAQILTEARALIDTPEKWTQGELARNSKGRVIDYESKNAVCYCAAGALKRSAERRAKLLYTAESLLARVANVEFVWQFNDTHSHAEVMELFDRAISLAKLENV